MLYDKRWERPEVKADPHSLENLIAWLEKKPARRTYCYMDNGACLMHQYFTACGLDVDHVGGMSITYVSGDWELLKNGMDDIAAEEPHTFGAALKRARKVACPQVTVPEAD